MKKSTQQLLMWSLLGYGAWWWWTTQRPAMAAAAAPAPAANQDLYAPSQPAWAT